MSEKHSFKIKFVIPSVLILMFVIASSSAAAEQSLYQRLLSNDEGRRVAAVKELHEAFNIMSLEQKRQLITSLVEATAQVGTKDGSQPHNAGKAMTALTEIGTPAIPFLIQYLEEDLSLNPSDFPAYLSDLSPASLRGLTRGSVITILGKIRPPATEAVPLLVKILREKKNFSESAAIALGDIGVSTLEVINALQQSLQETDNEVYSIIYTAKALRQLGTEPYNPRPEVIANLFKQLQAKADIISDPPENIIYSQVEAAHALLLLNLYRKESIQVLLEGIDKIPGTTVTEIIRDLGPLAKETIPKLIEKLHEEYYPVAIVEALKSIGTPEALKAVKEYEQKVKTQ